MLSVIRDGVCHIPILRNFAPDLSSENSMAPETKELLHRTE